MGTSWHVLVLCVYALAGVVLVSASDWNMSHLLNNAEKLRLNVTWDAAGRPSRLSHPPAPARSPRVRIVFDAADSPFLLRTRRSGSDVHSALENAGNATGGDGDEGDEYDEVEAEGANMDAMPSARAHDDVAALLEGTVRLFWPSRGSGARARCYCFDCPAEVAYVELECGVPL